MKNAVQLYSLRLLTEKDFDKALQIVSEAGYDGVEFAGFFSVTKEDMKSMLKKYNLEAMGAHTGAELLINDLNSVIEYNKYIGNKRIICPGYSLNNKADCLEFCSIMSNISKKLKEHDMELHYHNHSHEFVIDEGKYLMDIIAENICKCELKFEIDTFWVWNASIKPTEYLKKQKERITILHIKDGTKEVGTAVGSGKNDILGIIDFAKTNDIEWLVVEAEQGETIEAQIKDVTDSINYLKSVL